MDPVSHVVAGAFTVSALHASGDERFGDTMLAGVLGAVAPDADAVLMRHWDVYLRWHEVGTHSLAGAIAIGAMAGVVVTLFRRSSRAIVMMAAGAIGAASHLFLDSLTGARLGLFWPASEWRFPLPLFGMADLWLVVPLVVAALAAFRWRTVRIDRYALLVTAAIVLAKLWSFGGAKHLAADRLRPAAALRMFEARWSTWSQWTLYERDGETLRSWQIDIGSGTVTPALVLRRQPDTAAIAASRRLPTVQNLLRVHEFAFATEAAAEGNEHLVRWSDLRFCWLPGGASAVECALWFGGWVRDDGRPIRSVMQVGSWTRTETLPD